MGQSVTVAQSQGQEFGNQLPALGQALWVTKCCHNWVIQSPCPTAPCQQAGDETASFPALFCLICRSQELLAQG